MSLVSSNSKAVFYSHYPYEHLVYKHMVFMSKKIKRTSFILPEYPNNFDKKLNEFY